MGTASIRIAVTELVSGNKTPRVLALVKKDAKGLRRGYIMNFDETVSSIRDAVAEAEKVTKERIREVILGVGGLTLEAKTADGSTAVARADQEVTNMDVARALEAAEAHASDITNRRIIHTVPLSFKLDGKKIFGRPQGLKGNKLEAKVLFISSINQHLNDTIAAVEKAGLTIEDIVASPLAASFAVLTRLQKTAGCALVNIGAQTTSLVTLEEGIPIALQVFPIGSTDITNDIALGLKISLEEAEQMKVGIIDPGVQRKKFFDIIEARLSDIFEVIETHLKKIGRNGLLPAGISIIGGGAHIETIEEVAKGYLKLPAKVAGQNLETNSKGQIKDVAWAVAYGLCLFGADDEAEGNIGIEPDQRQKSTGLVIKWLKQFWP